MHFRTERNFFRRPTFTSTLAACLPVLSVRFVPFPRSVSVCLSGKTDVTLPESGEDQMLLLHVVKERDKIVMVAKHIDRNGVIKLVASDTLHLLYS